MAINVNKKTLQFAYKLSIFVQKNVSKLSLKPEEHYITVAYELIQ